MNWIQRRSRFRTLARRFETRTQAEWAAHWQGDDLSKVKPVCQVIMEVMGWRTSWFLPTDPLRDVFFNPTSDLREIEAMLQVERMTGIALEKYQTMTMRDLFAAKVPKR